MIMVGAMACGMWSGWKRRTGSVMMPSVLLGQRLLPCLQYLHYSALLYDMHMRKALSKEKKKCSDCSYLPLLEK